MEWMVLWKAFVDDTTTETYVGLATNFKERYRNHQTSFRHSKRRNETELSKHVWNLQDAKKPFRIKWKVLKSCKPYSNINKKCNLCLYEKFIIICKKELCSLNRRNEYSEFMPPQKPIRTSPRISATDVAEILGGICYKILIVLSFNPYALNYCIFICCIFSCTEGHALASARASAI